MVGARNLQHAFHCLKAKEAETTMRRLRAMEYHTYTLEGGVGYIFY